MICVFSWPPPNNASYSNWVNRLITSFAFRGARSKGNGIIGLYYDKRSTQPNNRQWIRIASGMSNDFLIHICLMFTIPQYNSQVDPRLKLQHNIIRRPHCMPLLQLHYCTCTHFNWRSYMYEWVTINIIYDTQTHSQWDKWPMSCFPDTFNDLYLSFLLNTCLCSKIW